MALTKEEVLRYSRHLIMPEVGVEGQEKLLNARVLIIGAGGLGSPLCIYLAAAGIGKIGIVDFDNVDVTNLQRQIIYRTDDVGKSKAETAKERIQALNPKVEVEVYKERLSSENALRIIGDYDIVIDGTDNFPTRYLTNDACVFLKKPNIYGSIFRFEGQATVFKPYEGPCYRCLYPEPPPPGMVPSCAEGGVLGILPGTIAMIQATEAIKIILGKGTSLVGRLILYNAMDMKFREVKLKRDKNCPVCGDNPTIKELINYDEFCGIGRGDEEVTGDLQYDITVQELKDMLNNGKPITLIDVREQNEWQICRIDGARLIPLSELAQRAHELDTSDEIVLQCQKGARSMKALKFLRDLGFRKLKNVKGGIDAWAREVDPEMPRY